jgi:hypothetical protein
MSLKINSAIPSSSLDLLAATLLRALTCSFTMLYVIPTSHAFSMKILLTLQSAPVTVPEAINIAILFFTRSKNYFLPHWFSNILKHCIKKRNQYFWRQKKNQNVITIMVLFLSSCLPPYTLWTSARKVGAVVVVGEWSPWTNRNNQGKWHHEQKPREEGAVMNR